MELSNLALQFCCKARWTPQFAFPYDNDFPAFLSQKAAVGLVPCHSSGKFCEPIFTVCARGGCPFAFSMSMPETAVYEHDRAVLTQYNIRLSWQVVAVKSKSIAHAMQH